MLFRSTPTVDLYFLHGLRHLVSIRHGGTRKRPIWRIGPNCFFCNGAAVIIRYARTQELRKLQALKPVRCAYVIDDDLAALDTDDSLPADYRQRLLDFRTRTWRQIVDMCDWVVAPNPRIFHAYPGKQQKLLHPAMLLPDTAHHRSKKPSARKGEIHLVFSGTRSHRTDLQAIAPALSTVLARHPRVSLTTFLGRHAPASLQGPNIHHHKPLSWRSYQRMQQRSHFHVALMPMRNTAFNRARSMNKILDAAAFGSAGLYPDLPNFREYVTDGKEGFLLPAEESIWEQVLEQLLQEPHRLQELAAKNLALARRIGCVEKQRDWWLQWLGLQHGKGN